MTASDRSQIEVFEQVRDQMVSEVSAEVLKWDFGTMLQKLRRAVEEKTTVGGERNPNPLRFFTRNYLKLSGEAFRKVRKWLDGSAAMSADDVTVVLRTLNTIYYGEGIETPVAPIRAPRPTRPERKRNSVAAPTATPLKGVRRKLIDHTISLCNSLVGLTAETGINPEDVLDGDRMQVRSALERICDAYGIEAIFPEPGKVRTPVTAEDLNQMGLGSFKRGDS
jgi:hypothetical protein